MKTLIIYPDTGNTVYTLLDPETGECLAQHMCSDSVFAMGDLCMRWPERIIAWGERFGSDFVVKFADDNFDLAEFEKRNAKFNADQDSQDQEVTEWNTQL